MVDTTALPLPLDSFRAVLGYHPYHFWQQANTIAGLRIVSNCNTLVREYAWQDADAVGRNEIREAIKTAGRRLFEHLNYRVGQYYTEKILPYAQPYDGRMMYTRPADATGRYLALNVGEGYIQAIGTEARTSIGSASVTYTDDNGDGVTDTATITIATTVTDTSEIAVYFAAADRLNSAAVSERWRIEPAQVTIAGGTATIIIPSWVLVRPIKYEGVASGEIDPNDTTLATNNFAQSVEVYRRYTDPTGTTTSTAQAMLIWETDPPYWNVPCVACADAPTYDPYRFDPAAQAYAIARAVIRDPRRGEIALGEAVYNATDDRFVAVDWTACKPPDRVVIRYLAGAERNEVDSQINYGGSWDVTLSRLAMAELNQKVCACDYANRELHNWQTDLSRISGANDELYRITDSDLQNPFGTRRGHLYAWKQVQNLVMSRGFAVG